MAFPLILLLLALLGALDAAWLTHAGLFGSDFCAEGSDCGAVTTSAYARVSGVPLSAFGLGFYLAVVAAAWRALRPAERADALRGASLLVSAGSLTSFVLIYLQAFVIRARCPLCLVSAALTFALCAVSLLARARGRTLRPFVGPVRLSRHALPVALALALPPLAFLPLQSGVREAAARALRAEPEVVARIGDREITAAEIDRAIRIRLDAARNELRSEWLDAEVLAAAAREQGLTVNDLLQRDVLDTIAIVQEEVDWRYEQIKGHIPPDVSRDSADVEIRKELRWYRSEPAREDYARQLRTRYGTEFVPPKSERIALNPNPWGAAEKGPAGAPVTIVEFSDLQCRHCAAAHTLLESLVAEHPDRVRVVFRHFPLRTHAHARHAAEVAVCAQRQGAFWPLAGLLFANQDKLAPEDLRRHAAAAGLDIARLDSCLASGDPSRAVDADLAEGKALGIDGTPTFFVNGRHAESPDHVRGLVERGTAADGVPWP